MNFTVFFIYVIRKFFITIQKIYSTEHCLKECQFGQLVLVIPKLGYDMMDEGTVLSNLGFNVFVTLNISVPVTFLVLYQNVMENFSMLVRATMNEMAQALKIFNSKF